MPIWAGRMAMGRWLWWFRELMVLGLRSDVRLGSNGPSVGGRARTTFGRRRDGAPMIGPAVMGVSGGVGGCICQRTRRA